MKNLQNLHGIKDYYLLSPTGNITVLAEKPDCMESMAELPTIAAALIGLEPSAEQVGFLSDGNEEADICLTMAGGEFCGNAALSAAAVYVWKNGLCGENGECVSVKVRVAGTDAPVNVLIGKQKDREYSGAVGMPSAQRVLIRTLDWNGMRYSLPSVDFQGITHMICEPDSWDLFSDKEAVEQAVKCWCGELGVDALGIMRADYEHCSLVPLVYVKSAGTLFWESSCASGTCAAGVYYAERHGRKAELSFDEPAGKLSVEAFPDGKVTLCGKVILQEIVSVSSSFQ